MNGAAPATGIDVIVPIYNAADATAACLDALATRLPDWAGVQLVDDASTDPAIAPLLAGHRLARADNVRVIRQQRNLGFVATVNAAMARSDRDVVLLNSDTVVTTGWPARLCRFGSGNCHGDTVLQQRRDLFAAAILSRQSGAR